MRKVISLVIVLAAGVALLIWNRGGRSFYERQDDKNSPNFASSTLDLPTTSTNKHKISEKVTVIYTDNGFEPAVVIIKVNGTVDFVNKSRDKKFFPVFALTSPVSYPGQAGTLVFKFENAGEFGFSAATHPERFGAIVVR